MSDRGDNITEANLQADGLREEPAQGAAERWVMEEGDSSPITRRRGPLSRGCLQAILMQTIVYRYK